MRLNRIYKFLAALVLTASTVSAQVTIPNTFSSNTVAQSALVNANFSQLGQQALNRAGGIITGNVSVDPGVTIDGIDIGAVLGGTGTPTFASVTTTGAITVGTTLTVSSTSASAIDVAGGINAGSGNVSIVDTTGKIPAFSSTYFASLDGSAITNIAETNITDGSLLARVAGNETISGAWTFTSTSGLTISGGGGGGGEFFVTNSAAGSNVKTWLVRSLAGTFSVEACDDAISACNSGLSYTRTTNTPGLLSLQSALGIKTITPSTLASGNTNDYAPTSGTTSAMWMLTGNASNSVLTGISIGQADGRVLIVCDSGSGGTIQISNNDAASTSGNRFDLGVIAGNSPRLRSRLTTSDFNGPCMTFIYMTSFWRLQGPPQIS